LALVDRRVTLAQALGISAAYSALALTSFSLGTLIASLSTMRFTESVRSSFPSSP
jgi:predicted MFS family arabinose efflux permease